MKLVKIFGMVLALHVVLLTIFFLSPGCQSTPSNPPPVTSVDTENVQPVSQAAPADENWSSQAARSSDQTPSAPSRFESAPLTGLTPAERARSAPTRPDDPSSFFGGAAGSRASTPQPEPEEPRAASSARTTYTVVAGDSLWKISRSFGITIPELQNANPNLRGNTLRPGDTINIPAGATRATQAAASQGVTSDAAEATYVVRSGDSLSKIAARHGTTLAALRSANNLTSDTIQIGQRLVIPGGARPQPPETRTQAAPQPEGVTVVLQPGETLSELAQRFDVTVQELMRANNITNPRRIRAGQTLVIPGFQPVQGGPGTPPANRQEPAPTEQPPTGTPPSDQPPQPDIEEPVDLDELVPDDAPIVPIDEPMPTP